MTQKRKQMELLKNIEYTWELEFKSVGSGILSQSPVGQGNSSELYLGLFIRFMEGTNLI